MDGQISLFDFMPKDSNSVRTVCLLDKTKPCNILNAHDVARDLGFNCNYGCCNSCEFFKECGARCGNASKFKFTEKACAATLEPPILLEKGQKIYKVVRGEVEEFEVYDEKSWLCGEEKQERGYRLKKDFGYDCTWNKSIGIDVFIEKENAMLKAQEYISTHDVILSESITAIEAKTYSYIRNCDSREMKSFYAILKDGKAYIKNFMTYEHIIDFGSVENARKELRKAFYKQQEFEYYNLQEIDYSPTFKNMYLCNKKADFVKWNYAEARYSGCI